MRRRGLAALGAIAAVGLTGLGLARALDPPTGDREVVELLSGISFVPSRTNLDVVFGEAAVDDLIELVDAASPDVDPGLRIRAMRALGQYADSPDADLAAAALSTAIDQQASATEGTGVLYLRAAMLGLAEVDGPDAVATLAPLLDHPSRDVRVAAADALAITGAAAAMPALRARAAIEEISQVKRAIEEALRVLEHA